MSLDDSGAVDVSTELHCLLGLSEVPKEGINSQRKERPDSSDNEEDVLEQISEQSPETSHQEASDCKTKMCDLCGKCFKRASSLKVHKLTHSDQRDYECAICGKQFKRKHHLKIHTHLHTGQKLHSCDICDKGFVTAASLKNINTVTLTRRNMSVWFVVNILNKSPTSRDIC